jgi:hypothetical protein
LKEQRSEGEVVFFDPSWQMRGRLETMRYVLSQFDYPDMDPAIARPPDPLIVTSAQDLLDAQSKSHMID